MRALEKYLSELNRHLIFIDGRIRREILREVRTHLVESAEERGGIERAIEAFGTPREVASRYTEVYEVSVWVHLLGLIIAGSIGFISQPFTGFFGTFMYSLLAVLLVAMSIKLGKRCGIISSIGGVAGRVAGALFIYTRYSAYISYTPVGVVLFLVSTFLLIPMGYYPGKLREEMFRE